MPLSAHEKTQFERLTADLELDTSALREMEKRERTTPRSHSPRPRISARTGEMITMAMVVLGLLSVPVAFLVLLADNFAGSFAILFAGCLIISVSDVVETRAKKR